MNKDVFGLDIGATTMKLVWLKHGKGGYVLNAAMIAPTPPKGILSESPLDEEEMARAIKKIKDDAGVSIKRVNVALAENQVYTSVVGMFSIGRTRRTLPQKCKFSWSARLPY